MLDIERNKAYELLEYVLTKVQIQIEGYKQKNEYLWVNRRREVVAVLISCKTREYGMDGTDKIVKTNSVTL
ncbi:hypothetical protein [Bacillus cereus]|uniref:hypothetical protein n=1 Tax=Bacillus cereus TaxID=1396 RepID=UPI000A302CB7|nr:hypothetical protein [Bacillus cereus]MCU5385844.1 hypothetical protein [Bacillus cereus]QXW42529.1 hypothetical protein KXJ78_27395 [Klebsiella grimontii]SMD70102.1 hypothetical protein BACERE00195_00579 [Bacillus cereus]